MNQQEKREMLGNNANDYHVGQMETILLDHNLSWEDAKTIPDQTWELYLSWIKEKPQQKGE